MTTTTTPTTPVTMTPQQLADRFQMWLRLVTDGHLLAAREVWKTLLETDPKDGVRQNPRGTDGKRLVDHRVWMAADHWKGGRVHVRYVAQVHVLSEEYAKEENRKGHIDVDAVYVEELKTTHTTRNRWTGKVESPYRVLGYKGDYLTVEAFMARYSLTADDAVNAAVQEFADEVETQRARLAENEREYETARGLAQAWQVEQASK